MSKSVRGHHMSMRRLRGHWRVLSCRHIDVAEVDDDDEKAGDEEAEAGADDASISSASGETH